VDYEAVACRSGDAWLHRFLCPGGSLCAYGPGQKTIWEIVFPAIGKADRQRDQQTMGRGTFVPLHLDPGEAFQFDWSEDFAVLGGERATLQMRISSCRTAEPSCCAPIHCRPMRCC
jgi:hypothetical protein